jgi:hypothetical protein
VLKVLIIEKIDNTEAIIRLFRIIVNIVKIFFQKPEKIHLNPEILNINFKNKNKFFIVWVIYFKWR